MAEIKLKFVESQPISKERPFEESEFLYFKTDTLFGEKLNKLLDELEDWSIDENDWGDAYFAGAHELEDSTYFSLRMNYRSMPPLSKDESTQFIYDIIESFTLFFYEIKWLK